MLNKTFIFVFICIFWFSVSNAEEQPLLTPEQAKPTLWTYASSIGCTVDDDPTINHYFLPEKNFVHFQIPDEPETYVTAVNVDVGCGGGNTTRQTKLIVIGRIGFGNSLHIKVLPEYSEPNAVLEGDDPNTITSLYVKNGRLHATGMDSVDGSGKCPCIGTIFQVKPIFKKTGIKWHFTKIGTYGSTFE